MDKKNFTSKKSIKLINCDVEEYLKSKKNNEKFDLVVTSPPYNIGKEYEKKKNINEYLDWQKNIIDLIVPKLKDSGSICWQVGNYVDQGKILPLDILLHEIFHENKLHLRNRIIWSFGHGFHAKKRFSGRYEVIMWYTKSDDYVFNLDDVRVPSMYPNKKFYKGPNKGKVSSNPLGKNPSDIWDIPNVKSLHIEKTDHPCQFPVALVQRLVLALTNKGGKVFDPFMGVASSGIASISNKREYIGTEIDKKYFDIAKKRINDFYEGKIKIRSAKPPEK